MNKLFVSEHRKISTLAGTGIQYIPGHFEPFIDYVISKYLCRIGSIVDLGGGGLRFAIPAAMKGYKVDIVDLDKTALDIHLIINKLRNNKDNNAIHPAEISLLINPIHRHIIDFLEENNSKYMLITAFRLIHFFSMKEVDIFFRLANDNLESDGHLIISAISPYDNLKNEFNEFYRNTKPIHNENIYYRKFNDSKKAETIKKEQNFQNNVHLFTKNYILKFCEKYNYKLIESNIASTRIVRGYVLRKK